MIPKLITAFVSAAILSAVLGTLPCEATGAKPQGRTRAAPASIEATSAATSLNRPATDFTGIKAVVDNPHPDLIPPKRDRNQFFDQKLR